MSALGLAPPPEQEDLYEETRRFPAVYDPEEDADYQEEAAIAREELKTGAPHVTSHAAGSDSDSEESASESDSDDTPSNGDADGGILLRPTTGSRAKKPLSCVNKVRTVVSSCSWLNS